MLNIFIRLWRNKGESNGANPFLTKFFGQNSITDVFIKGEAASADSETAKASKDNFCHVI